MDFIALARVRKRRATPRRPRLANGWSIVDGRLETLRLGRDVAGRLADRLTALVVTWARRRQLHQDRVAVKQHDLMTMPQKLLDFS